MRRENGVAGSTACHRTLSCYRKGSCQPPACVSTAGAKEFVIHNSLSVNDLKKNSQREWRWLSQNDTRFEDTAYQIMTLASSSSARER
jgi:hypothetical protein